MINYVPEDQKERDRMIAENALFKEIFERRMNAKDPCNNCDISKPDIIEYQYGCDSCCHCKKYCYLTFIYHGKDWLDSQE